MDLVAFLGRGDTRLDQLSAVGDDRIHGFPSRDFFLGAVGGGVRRAVAGEAVGEHVQKHRALAFLKQLLLAAVGLDHGQGVEAIHALGVHLRGGEARAQPRQHVVAHRLADGLAAHAVVVVEDVEEDREARLHVAFPKLRELAHGREVERLKHRAAAEGAVADVGHDHAVLTVDLLVECSARRDIGGAAHQRVVGVDAKGREEGVHGAAQAAVEACDAGEDLRHRAVDQKVDGQCLDAGMLAAVNDLQDLAAEELLHDLEERVVRKLLNRR